MGCVLQVYSNSSVLTDLPTLSATELAVRDRDDQGQDRGGAGKDPGTLISPTP